MNKMTLVVACPINGIMVADDIEDASDAVFLEQQDFYDALNSTREPIASFVSDRMLSRLAVEYGVY